MQGQTTACNMKRHPKRPCRRHLHQEDLLFILSTSPALCTGIALAISYKQGQTTACNRHLAGKRRQKTPAGNRSPRQHMAGKRWQHLAAMGCKKKAGKETAGQRPQQLTGLCQQ